MVEALQQSVQMVLELLAATVETDHHRPLPARQLLEQVAVEG